MKCLKWFPMLFVGVLAGCSSPQQEYVFTQSVPAKTEVLQEILVSIPMDIKKQGDLLYVSDFNGDSLLSCYSISERHLVGKMLPQGQGAGEFLSPVEFFPADSTFFVHNRWHFTAQDYSFDLPALSIRPQGELMRLPMGADHLCPVCGSRWVVSPLPPAAASLIIRRGKRLCPIRPRPCSISRSSVAIPRRSGWSV